MWKIVHTLLTDEEAETEAYRRRMMERKRGERKIYREQQYVGEILRRFGIMFSLSFSLSLSVPQLPEISQRTLFFSETH